LARVAHTASIVADLDEEVLQEIFMTTLAHHQLRLPNNLLAFRIGLIQYRNTGRFNSRQRNRRAQYYHLILNAETNSGDDPTGNLCYYARLGHPYRTYNLVSLAQFPFSFLVTLWGAAAAAAARI
jgi:hypothetical protein